MTTPRAQHASALTPRAPLHGARADLARDRLGLPRLAPAGRGALSHSAHATALLAIWAASWIFLGAAVAAPAGRMHAASAHPDRALPVAGTSAAVASVAQTP